MVNYTNDDCRLLSALEHVFKLRKPTLPAWHGHDSAQNETQNEDKKINILTIFI
jgi:hypothetical protein